MSPPEFINTRRAPVSQFPHERPILFSAPMVRALLDGSKTISASLRYEPPSKRVLGVTSARDFCAASGAQVMRGVSTRLSHTHVPQAERTHLHQSWMRVNVLQLVVQYCAGAANGHKVLRPLENAVSRPSALGARCTASISRVESRPQRRMAVQRVTQTGLRRRSKTLRAAAPASARASCPFVAGDRFSPTGGSSSIRNLQLHSPSSPKVSIATRWPRYANLLCLITSGLPRQLPEGEPSGRRLPIPDLQPPLGPGARAACRVPPKTALARPRCGHEPSASPAALHAGLLPPRCHKRSLLCRWAVGFPAHARVCGEERRLDDSRLVRTPRQVRTGSRDIQGSGRRKLVCCRLSWMLPREFFRACAAPELTKCRREEGLPEGRHAVGTRR